jgi:hypothetical protein
MSGHAEVVGDRRDTGRLDQDNGPTHFVSDDLVPVGGYILIVSIFAFESEP